VLTVSERTVRRRIGKLGAFERDAARHGEDYAMRKYLQWVKASMFSSRWNASKWMTGPQISTP